MIIVKLRGGLGNQLFQYAYGKALSMKLGVTVKFDGHYYFDKEFQNSDAPRKYLLDKFNTDAVLASRAEIAKIDPLWKKFLRKVRNNVFGHGNPYVFQKSELATKDRQFLVGYWQTEKYFKDIETTILESFTLKNNLGSNALEVANLIKDAKKDGFSSVSIHVRRSDYVAIQSTSAFFNICGIEYYKKAFDVMQNRISSPIQLFVFSDDIEWAQKNFSFPCPMHFVSDPQHTTNPCIHDYEELILMSQCSHNIIANSSFSWWAAWLNQNVSKTVIAPKQWVADHKMDTRDVTPETWVTI